MFDSGKMLRPRQAPPDHITPDDPTFGPGPADPPTTSSPPDPGLPLPFSPIPTSLETTPAMPPASTPITVTTVTVGGSTITIPFPGSTGSESGTLSLSFLSSTSPSQTQSTSGPSPSSGPSWIFAGPANATTCQPLRIHWSVQNPTSVDLSQKHMQLVITNTGLKRDTVNLTLTTNQPLLNNNYTWSAVTVPPGPYAIIGTEVDGSGITVESPVFSVQAGPNTTCVSSSGSGQDQGNNLSTTSKGTNKGAIAGGTVGGVILLACVGVALFFLCSLRHRSTRVKSGRRTWAGLGSMDSKASRKREASPGDSNDYLGAGRDSAIGAGPPTRVASAYSLDGEKLGSESIGHGSGLPVLTHHGNWSFGNRFEMDSTLHGAGRASVEPSVELGPVSPRSAAQDSPRSSLDFSDPFASTPNTNNRRSSRTPRKPVPAYNPTPEELDAMALARTRSGQSYPRSQQPSPSALAHHPSPSLSTSSASQHGEALLHGLKSKSSGHFDNQPMHYLIPDMPPAPPVD